MKERPTGTFQIGAGFSSYENFILTGQISQNNFFGWGQTALAAGPVVEDPPALPDPVRRAVLPRHASGRSPSTSTRPRGSTRRSPASRSGGRSRGATSCPGSRVVVVRAVPARGHAALRDVHERAGGRHRRAGGVTTGDATSSSPDDELGAPLAAVGQARQPPLPDGGASSSSTSPARSRRRSSAPSALFGNEVNLFARYAFDARVLPPDLAGARRRAQADARPHPRLGRGAPGPDLRALLRGRHQLGPRLPLPLDLADASRPSALGRPDAGRSWLASAATSR